MPPILLDVTRLLTRLHDGLIPTGVDRVGLAYVERYGQHARAVLSERGYSTVLSQRTSAHLFSLLLASRRDRWEIRRIVADAVLRSLRPTRLDSAILLHTSHSGMEFVRYYNSMHQRNVKSVFMVHDLIPLTHAEYCRPGVDAAHRARIHTALRNASGLIANSQDTLDALDDEARACGLALPPCTVAHLAPAITRGQTFARPIEEPYFVMLGTIEPRKNHWFMLHIWRELAKRHGTSAPRLVIVGRRGWECENVVDMLERCAPIRELVIEESHCSDDRLQAWLQHAQALLFPSFAEGYGMPLVEALALQTPVLASDLPVFHEIANNIPEYIAPLDGTGWLANITEYARPDSQVRQAQITRISDFREPTWREHFQRVDAFLENLG
ncbi:glycosyltransferase family 4 protein [Burkholderia gladioli]|uniref:glycosyltransferase family 4 protein n=1 Tax=Burkholderia gladioli TaxID=28095 RepID=UPI0026572F39|nr:glycosyltransferase family 1 protein [Burkholderia gladioli]MDN7718696.1 glycosyltransferase family 1 protein [Burkholderia gladioli]